MPDGTGTPPPRQEERSVSELVFDVAEKSSSLVREEIELAKTEITEKVGKILRGSVVGVAAGIFAFLALILIMEGVAWLLAEEVFDGNAWPGFFVEAALFLLIAAGAGFFAYRSVQAGAPPLPEQAIEEAKLTKATWNPGRRRARNEHPPRALPPTDHRLARPLGGADPPRHRSPAPRSRQLGRDSARPRHRADRLAPPGREHRSQLIIGAAVAGFALGGLMMLRRRR